MVRVVVRDRQQHHQRQRHPAAVKQRSETNRGLLAWLADTTADVVCLQETRADDLQLTAALAPALADGWHLASANAHLKGRNGVAILSRHPFTTPDSCAPQCVLIAVPPSPGQD